MKKLNLAIERSGQPKYRALADGIRAAIRNGLVKPGEKLPSSRELAKQFRMHRHTVMAALGELESEGWISSLEKRHSFVSETLPDKFLQPLRVLQREFPSSKKPLRVARESGISKSAADERKGYKHSFPSGFPDLRLFPLREFKSHVYDAISASGILEYGDPSGHPALIDQVDEYLRRVRGISGRKIVVTNGSQEGLFLLAQVLIAPGDSVAVEALGYPPAVETFRFAGAKLVPIPVDREGIDVDELERRLKRQRIRFVYTTPLHQYPTTVTLSAARRLRLYELAVKHDMRIIEDDYDHEFHYASQPVAPLASFDPAEIVLYVTTFSKVLFPSSRVGFVALPAAVAEHITKLKRISTRQNEQILQVAIAGWMRDGGFERHLRKMRRIYGERRDAMIADLARIQEKNPLLSWLEPDGGMALWLDLGLNSSRFADLAKKRSVHLTPESDYRLDGSAGTHVRLGFTGYTAEQNRAALAKMFE